MSIDIFEPQVQAPLAISAYDPAESLIQPIGWNPLKHTKGGGTPAGKKRGGSYSIRGGRRRRPFDMYPEGVHYMDSGLDSLNTMFPTAASMPYDPFYLKNVAMQKKNMDPNAYWTGPKDPALATVVVNGKKKLLKDITSQERATINKISHDYGGGFDENDYAVGGQLAAPSGYDSGHNYDTGVEDQAPVPEYASSSYRPSANVSYYGL